MKHLHVVLCMAVLLMAASAYGQSARSLVREGNDRYEAGKYSDAETKYRQGLEKDQHLAEGHFNLGDALHRQGKYPDAVNSYQESITKAESEKVKASAYYNIGNSLMREQKYQEAIQSYVDALKLEPGDADTKFNLSYALKKLQEQQQQQDKNQQQNKDQKQDRNQQQQSKQDQQKQDQQKQDQQKSQQPQQQRSMSKAEAQRILEVLKNNERDIQKKLRVRQAVRPKSDKDW